MSVKLLVALPAALFMSTAASAYTLTNGSGDGSLSVEVDFYGAFGCCIGDDDSDSGDFGDGDFRDLDVVDVGDFNRELIEAGDLNREELFVATATDPSDNFSGEAIYNPVGAIDSASTVYESFVAYGQGFDQRQVFAQGVSNDGLLSDASFVSGDALELVTSFSVGDVDFVLTQSLSDSFNADNELVGTALTQTYVATNTGDETEEFDVVRYIDGDLDFDGLIDDSGGRIEVSGNEILFETDSASDDEASTTFLGITAMGGETPSEGRFEISSYDDLRQTVLDNGALGDLIEGDGNGDGFIDNPYDVTMALANEFTLGAGDTETYTTTTLFGNAVIEDLPTPGESETNPLLPEDLGPEGGFVFNLDPEDIDEGEIIWFDPIVSVGYTYEITGAEFSAVQAPSLAAVNDADGYTLTYGGTSVALAPGQLINFGSPVTNFTITGINPALELDPGDTMAFMTGLALINVGGTTVTLTQTPIEFDTDSVGTTPVPVPPAFLLLGTALGLIGWKGRKRAA